MGPRKSPSPRCPISTETIRVFGAPAPQGSKNPYGGESSKRVGPWRTQVAQTIGFARRDEPLLAGPVCVEVTFAFTRPKKHYVANNPERGLRPDAPFWHTAPGDTDKLCRAIGDALTEVAWIDDRQVAWWNARKIYDEKAYADITIIDLEHQAGGSDDQLRDTGARARKGTGDAGAHDLRPMAA